MTCVSAHRKAHKAHRYAEALNRVTHVLREFYHSASRPTYVVKHNPRRWIRKWEVHMRDQQAPRG